jgi:hypothetical protein
VFSAPRIEELTDDPRNTEDVASYPFKPFLRWNAIFPPFMEPRDTELVK